MSQMEIDYNSVAAFERSRQAERSVFSAGTFMIVLLGVFFIVLMIGLAAGVAMYQATANNQIDTNNARMQAGLLASNIHANDGASALGTGEGPEGRSLVLTKRVDGNAYELRIYLYKGYIVEEYSVAGSEYTPERAQPLLQSKSFDFQLRGSLLTLSTDQGSTNVALRSYQGGSS
jgi:hypothetical protein